VTPPALPGWAAITWRKLWGASRVRAAPVARRCGAELGPQPLRYDGFGALAQEVAADLQAAVGASATAESARETTARESALTTAWIPIRETGVRARRLVAVRRRLPAGRRPRGRRSW
jgi:hypothetical protein